MSGAVRKKNQRRHHRRLHLQHLRNRLLLRQQALGCLKANLEELESGFEEGDEEARTTRSLALLGWQRSPDLAGVRDGEALSRLPEAEARAWRAFWEDIADRLAR